MAQFKTVEDIKRLGTVLCVWAHPDDETFTSGGLLAAAVQNGQQVIVVTATKGEGGIQDESRWPSARLGEIRGEELQAALKILGIGKHHWLGYADGACKDAPADEAMAQIKKLIEEYKPDTVLTFGPEGLTGHDDHRAVSAWATKAARDAGVAVYHVVLPREIYEAGHNISTKYNFFFNIDKPPLVEEAESDIWFELPEELLIKKYRALAAMPSQYEAVFTEFGQEAIYRMLRCEAFVAVRAK